ncbi:hypothetical protein ACLMJK_003265 [Lecanora helva]
MASAGEKPNTTYSTTNWAEYQKGRPPYPPSLTELIYEYRRKHSKAGWERLVDVGAGSGIASTNFMPDFKIIHISDPSPSNEEQARPFLSGWAESHGLNPAFEYTQATGEEAYLKTGEKQADLVICATAAHFMDPEALSTSIAKMLRPRGTLAVYSYWMPTFPDKSQHFHDVFEKTLEGLVLKPNLSGGEAGRAMLTKVIERRMTGKGALDSLPLYEDLYDDRLRVYINAGTELPYRSLSRHFPHTIQKLDSMSRVNPGDQSVSYVSGVHPEAEGWAFESDKEGISRFLDSVRPLNNKVSEEEYRAVYGEWERTFDEECPSGTVRIHWPLYLALATRKES